MHSKLAFEDKLHGKKQHIRPMMIARIHLQHEVHTPFLYSVLYVNNNIMYIYLSVACILIPKHMYVSMFQTRIVERSMSTTTDLHLSLLKDLFRMSVSAYAEVRTYV